MQLMLYIDPSKWVTFTASTGCTEPLSMTANMSSTVLTPTSRAKLLPVPAGNTKMGHLSPAARVNMPLTPSRMVPSPPKTPTASTPES